MTEAGSADDTRPYVTLKIPASLAARVEKRLANSEFKSIDSYVAYLVEQVLAQLEGAKGEEPAFTPDDQAAVEKKLRDLGYV